MANPMSRLDSTDFQNFLEQTGDVTDGDKAKKLFGTSGALAPMKTEGAGGGALAGSSSGGSSSNKDSSELRAAFVFRGAFESSYQRNNKKGGKKHLRCFPCCGAEHKPSRACQVPVNVHCKLKRSMPKVPVSTLASYVAVARFVVADELDRDTMVVGQDLPASQLAMLTRSTKEPLLPLYRGHVSSVKDRQLDFEFMEKGWHYGWRSARYKEQVYHNLVVYIFRPASPDFEWPEDVAGSTDIENITSQVHGSMKCVQKVISPRFSLYSSRSVNGKAAAAATATAAAAASGSSSAGDPRSPDSGVFTDNGGDSARNSEEVTANSKKNKKKEREGRKSAAAAGKSKSKRGGGGGGKRKAGNDADDENDGDQYDDLDLNVSGWSPGVQSEEAAMFENVSGDLDFNFNESDRALLDFDDSFNPKSSHKRHGGNKGSSKKGRNDKGKRIRVEDEFRPLEPGEASPDSDFAGDFQMLVWPFMAPPVHEAILSNPNKPMDTEQMSDYSSESEESETDSEEEDDESGSQTDGTITDGEDMKSTGRSPRAGPSKAAGVKSLGPSSPWSKNKNKSEVPSEVAEQANEAAEKLRAMRQREEGRTEHHPLSQYADGSRAVPRSGNSDDNGSGRGNSGGGIQVELTASGNSSSSGNGNNNEQPGVSVSRGDSFAIPTAIVIEQEHLWQERKRKNKSYRILKVLAVFDVILVIATIVIVILAAQKNPGDKYEPDDGVPRVCLIYVKNPLDPLLDPTVGEDGARRLVAKRNRKTSGTGTRLLGTSQTVESGVGASRTAESGVGASRTPESEVGDSRTPESEVEVGRTAESGVGAGRTRELRVVMGGASRRRMSTVKRSRVLDGEEGDSESESVPDGEEGDSESESVVDGEEGDSESESVVDGEESANESESVVDGEEHDSESERVLDGEESDSDSESDSEKVFEKYIKDSYNFKGFQNNQLKDLFQKTSPTVMPVLLYDVLYVSEQWSKMRDVVELMTFETLRNILTVFSKTSPQGECPKNVEKAANDYINYLDNKEEYSESMGLVGPMAGVTGAMLVVTAAVAVWGSSRFRQNTASTPKQGGAPTTDLSLHL